MAFFYLFNALEPQFSERNAQLSISASCDCSVSTVSWDEDDDFMNSCGTKFVVFHPLTSFEVKTNTFFEIFKFQREIKNKNYAKLSDEGLAGPKTSHLDVETYPIHRNTM